MPDTYHLSDYPAIVADCIDGMTGTDNAPALNALIASMPAGSKLVISPKPSLFGAPAHGDSPGYGFASMITVDHPISIEGFGMFSRLVPLGGFPTNAPNIHLVQNGYYWAGVELSNFLIGTSWFAPPFTRNGGEGILVDGGSTSKMFWNRLLIGESGNGRSLRITGIGSQHHSIDECTIHGGIHLDGVADGQSITRCDIGGRSIYSGVLAYMPGAGSLKIINNPSVTAVGGIVVQGVSMPIIENNYCEELPGFPTNNYANNGGYNAMIGFVGYPGNVYAGRIVRNILNMGVSGAGNGFNVPGATGHCIGLNSAVHGVVNTLVAENEFNISTNRGYINSQDPNLTMGPNTYVQPSWSRFKSGSVAPTQTYGGG